MNMMSIAFRFRITAANIHAIPKNMIAVNVKVTPQLSLFTFVTAVAFSLVNNHVILAFHRNIVSEEVIDDGRRGSSSFRSPSISTTPTARTRLLDPIREEEEIDVDSNVDYDVPTKYCVNFPEGSWFDAGTREAVESKNKTAMRIAFSKISIVGHRFSPGTLPKIFVDKESLTLRLSLRIFLFLFSILVFCLIVASAFEDTFQFVFRGLAGDLIKIVDPELITRRLSLISIGKELGEEKASANRFGVLYLQCFYMLFSFIFPLVVLFMATLMMFVRFTLRQAKMFFYALEVVSAWAALDVFIVAIIASILQINQFAHFLEGPYCDPLYKYLGIKECFGVETQLLKGCWLIVAASICFWCFVQFVQRISERAIADREELIIDLVRVN
jgi:hypothetical protein